MNLKKYQTKRNFQKTTEPKGEEQQRGQSIFMVHKHYARNLHYDFRLEDGGVLKSWAVPKGPPTEAGIKRLAVQVEDHPIGYGNFEGVIPEGEYGAGKVEIWDKGPVEFIKNEPAEIVVKLKGKKLKGEYVLVQPKSFDKKQWLLLKTKG